MAEIQSAQPTAIPSWAMLDQFFLYKDMRSFRAHGETSAKTEDSNGDTVRASVEIQSPPGSSRLCLHFPAGRESSWWDIVVAAHRDAILFRIEVDFDGLPVNQSAMDYFIYRACPPPSGPKLTLLPRCYSTSAEISEALAHDDASCSWRRKWRMVTSTGIGLLVDDGVFVVAELCIDTWSAADKTAPLEAELFRLFSPSADRSFQWELTLARSHDSKVSYQDIVGWETHTVVPFMSYLCWADYKQGVFFCDILTSTPELEYLQLPVEDMPPENFPTFSRILCVTNKGLDMKFVKVHEMPSCTNCKPVPDFTISVWTMTELFNVKKWVVDVEITDNELWSMKGYDYLPRSVPQCPLMSMDHPNILYFVVTGRPVSRRPALSDETATWIVTLDILSKTVLRYDDIEAFPSNNIFNGFGFFPSSFTNYLIKHKRQETDGS